MPAGHLELPARRTLFSTRRKLHGVVATSVKIRTAVQVVVGDPYQAATVLYAGPFPGNISAIRQIHIQLLAGVTGDHVPSADQPAGLDSQSGAKFWFA